MNILEGVGIVAIGLGSLALCISPIVLVVALADQRLTRRLTRTRVFTCGELAQAHKLPRRVAVTGSVRPGAEGIANAPVSAEACVWYRVEIEIHRDSEDGSYTSVHSAPDVVMLEDHTGRVALSAAALGTFVWRPDEERGKVLGHYGGAVAEDKEFAALMPRLRAVCPPNTIGLDMPRSDTRVTELHYRDGVPITVIARPRRTPQGVLLVARRGDGSSFRDLRALRSAAGLESAGSFSTVRGALLVALVLLPLGYGIVGLSRLIAS